MMMRSVQIRTRAAFVLPRRLFFDKVDRNWDTAWQQKVTPWELGEVIGVIYYFSLHYFLLFTVVLRSYT